MDRSPHGQKHPLVGRNTRGWVGTPVNRNTRGQEPLWTETLTWVISVQPGEESHLDHIPQPRSAITTTYPRAASL